MGRSQSDFVSYTSNCKTATNIYKNLYTVLSVHTFPNVLCLLAHLKLECQTSLLTQLHNCYGKLCNIANVQLVKTSCFFCLFSAILVLITYIDRTSLYCSSEHLIDTETRRLIGPTPFCTLSGL